MSFFINAIRGVNEILNKHADPRTNDWLFMSSPFYTLGICLSYVLIVKVIGPWFMENRKPLELRNTLIYYNLLQVLLSSWLFFECLRAGWWNDYSFKCQPVDYSLNPKAVWLSISGWLTGEYSYRCQPVEYGNHPRVMRMANICWWYYFSKFTEFFDTFFFVLRKKFEHVSTLHVIHHGIMPISVWFGVKLTPGGHASFFGFINSFVHIIMYSYYLLAAMGPQYQRFLWWKKYLTAFQMVQFVFIILHAFQLLFVTCDFPTGFVWWIGGHAVMFFFLFKAFYTKTYTPKERLKMQMNGYKINNGTNSSESKETNYSTKSIVGAADYYVKASEDIHLRANVAKINSGYIQ